MNTDPNTFEIVTAYILWGWMWATIGAGFIGIGYLYYDIVKDCFSRK